MIIKNIISQKCIGYSKDFKESHTESVAILDNGNQVTVYSTTTTSYKGYRSVSKFTLDKPFIAIPNPPAPVANHNIKLDLSGIDPR